MRRKILKPSANPKNYRKRWLILFALITFLILAVNFTSIDTVLSVGSLELPDNVLPFNQDVSSTVTELDGQILSKYGASGKAYLGLLFYVLLVYFIIWRYMEWYNANHRKMVNVVIFGVLFNSLLLIARVLSVINVELSSQIEAVSGLLLPMAGFTMLVSALLDRELAVFSTLMSGLFLVIIFEQNVLFIAAAMIGGVVGVSLIERMDQRAKYASVALYIVLAYTVLLLAWGFVANWHYTTITLALIMGVLNGFMSVVCAIGFMPFFESAFKITTNVHLLELSNFNHPLLKRLMAEAPGTYQHSMLVGNLAEAAAQEVNANALLARVASYFHDVGKLKRPEFFMENINNNDNPHDKLQPNMSVLILGSHPREGVELAREYKLPTEVVDIIGQHHGTGLFTYFYRKALETVPENLADTIKEEDFRYPGPKPQTKEAAIVLLADSVQAAVQSMGGASGGQVEGKIREVINSKFADGQLEECDLTFKDLDKIADAFTKVLAGVNHKRVDYKQLEAALSKK